MPPAPTPPPQGRGERGTCGAIADALLLLSASTASAQPYALDVVILRSDHRFLATEAFRERFPSRFANEVRRALGPAVQVTTTETHPNADTLRREGLGAPLDAGNAVTDRRTIFLRLRYDAGEFVVEARDVDGYTGLVSPGVVSARTGDRDQLSTLAAGLVANSFAVVGDVGKVQGDHAELRLLGGFGADVRPGDVFAASRIVVQEGRRLGQRIDWLVLEAEKAPHTGVIPCRIHRRYRDNGLDATSGTTYRALRLPAGSHPLELRLVEPKTLEPVSGVQAKIRAAGREVDVESDAQGMVRSKVALDRLAIVTFRSGGKDIARVPVPLVGDRPNCPLTVGADTDEETAHEVRREQWSARIVRDLALVDQRIGELPFELGRSLEEAKRHAQQTIALIDAEVKDLRTEQRELERIAPTSMKRGEADLARLAEQRSRLEETIRGFDQAIAEREASDQRRKESIALAQRAALFESQARFDEALVLYDQALAKSPELKKVREHVETLRAGWALRGNEHEQARKFLVEIWPRLAAEEVPAHLVVAEQALETCRKVGDKLTPRRFTATSGEQLKKIVDVMEPLRRSLSPEARDQLPMWKETVAKLRRLNNPRRDGDRVPQRTHATRPPRELDAEASPTVDLSFRRRGCLHGGAEGAGVFPDRFRRLSFRCDGVGRQFSHGDRRLVQPLVRGPAGRRRPHLRAREDRVLLQRPGGDADPGRRGGHRLGRRRSPANAQGHRTARPRSSDLDVGGGGESRRGNGADPHGASVSLDRPGGERAAFADRCLDVGRRRRGAWCLPGSPVGLCWIRFSAC